jgi:hypothetical protein
VLQDIVAKDPLVLLDIRLHNAVPLFRSAGMTRFMLVFTELGSATVLSLLCLGIALLALARGGRRLAVMFMLALAGTGLISVSLKALIGNARPIDAIISVHEASFPSGHMLSGTVVYGLLQQRQPSSWTGPRASRLRNLTQALQAFVGDITPVCGRRRIASRPTVVGCGLRPQVSMSESSSQSVSISRPTALIPLLTMSDC